MTTASPARVAGADVALRSVAVGYPGQRVFDDLTLSISAGVFTGIIGGNGSGKTTILKTIAGLLKPSQGEVLVGGETPRAARGFVGYVPQTSSVDWRFPISVRELVEMGRYQFRWGRRLRGLARGAAERAAVDRALLLMDVQHLAARQIHDLSGGQRQRALIARALAREPRLLLLDEPAAGLDAVHDGELFDILCDLAAHGTSVVMTTHDLSTVTEHYQQVICVNAAKGGIIAQGDPAAVLTEDILRQTFGRGLAIISRGDVHSPDNPAPPHHTVPLAAQLQLHMEAHEHQPGHSHDHPVDHCCND